MAEAREAAQALAASRFAAARSLGHVTLAQVALSRGSLDEARAEVGTRASATSRRSTWSRGPRATRSCPTSTWSKGSLQLRSDPEAGRALLDDVGRRLRALPGPDAWMQALFVLESIARTAREASDWELAERMARQMLEHDRAYAGGHYALGLVAEQRGDAAGAQQAFADRLALVGRGRRRPARASARAPQPRVALKAARTQKRSPNPSTTSVSPATTIFNWRYGWRSARSPRPPMKFAPTLVSCPSPSWSLT